MSPVLKGGLMGGVLCAVVLAIPFLNDMACCCCPAWAASGVFAAWVVQSDLARRADAWTCAQAGGLAGLVTGALALPLVGIVNRLAFGRGALERRVAEQLELARQWQAVPGMEGLQETMARALVGAEVNAFTPLLMAGMAVACAAFAVPGALAGHALFGAKAAPPPRRAPVALVRPEAAPPLPPLPTPSAEPAPEPSPAGEPPPAEPPRAGEIPLDQLPELPPGPDEPGGSRP